MARQTKKQKNTKASYQNEFYSDIQMDNMLYAAVVRSPASSGIITSISANKLPEGYRLITAQDVPGKNGVENGFFNIPLFSEGYINYLGEPVGLLVGPDEIQVQKLLGEIEITFDENTAQDALNILSSNDHIPEQAANIPENELIPAANDNEIAEISKMLELYDETDEVKKEKEFTIQLAQNSVNKKKKDTNFYPVTIAETTLMKGPLCTADDKGKIKGLSSVYKKAQFVHEEDLSFSNRVNFYGEPQGAVCYSSGEYLTVYTPTKWVSDLRHVLSSTLKTDKDKIIIKQTHSTDSSLTSLWFNSITAAQTSVASLCTGHPVKLVYTRKEQKQFMETMQKIKFHYKTALSEQGKILSMEVDISLDVGFNCPFAQEIVERLALASIGHYDIENYIVRGKASTSQNSSTALNENIMDSAAFFALETHLNNICLKSSFTPLELKRLNISDNDTLKVIEKCAAESVYHRKYTSYQWNDEFDINKLYSPTVAPYRGIGIAFGYEGIGYAKSHLTAKKLSVEVRFEKNNDIQIYLPPVDLEQEDFIKQTLSRKLDLSKNQIKMNFLAESSLDSGAPELQDSTASIIASLVCKCAETYQRKKTHSYPETIKKSVILSQNKNYFFAKSNAAACVELEIDPCTFREQLRGIWVTVTCGEIIDKESARKTIVLCVEKILSSLLTNEIIKKPKINISFVENKSPPVQVESIAWQIIPSAFAQALAQASRCSVNHMPITTDTIFNLLTEKSLSKTGELK